MPSFIRWHRPPKFMLRICHIITQLELGGAQQNTLYTLSHLDRQRFAPSLISGPKGLLDEDAVKGDWPTTFIPNLVRPIHPFKDIAALGTLYKILRRERPQVVHTHSSKAGILARVAAYAAGIPVIVHTFHGFGFTPEQPGWLRWLYVLVEKICAGLSTHLIFVSEDNRQEAAALKIGRNTPNSLIHSGISIKTAVPAAIREERGLPPEAWLVISVGNFKPQKNPLDLIRTAKAVIAQDKMVYFLLVGDGPLRIEAEDLSREEAVDEHVHFLGWRRDAPELIAACDAFLLTSLWEGLPRALVEAGAQSRPAVAYAVNGVKDLLQEGENGFPIEPKNWAAAAEKLLWLKNHPVEAQRMGSQAKNRISVDFNIDQMVREQESLYEALYDRVPLKEVYGLPSRL